LENDRLHTHHHHPSSPPSACLQASRDACLPARQSQSVITVQLPGPASASSIPAWTTDTIECSKAEAAAPSPCLLTKKTSDIASLTVLPFWPCLSSSLWEGY
jgi:hypothetical protein